MGQLVGVVEKPSSTPGVVRYELNRSLSGMGHERFTSPDQAYAATPSAALARGLFATGKVAAVHVYANQVTIDLDKGHDAAGLADVVRGLYTYWKPGVELPVFEEGAADDGAAAAPAASDEGGTLTPYEQLVPEHLRQRAEAGRVKWLATHG